jgi:hypothetical protein
MLHSLTLWRRTICRSYAALHTLHIFCQEVDHMSAARDGHFGQAVCSGPELRALLQEQLEVLDTALGFVDQLTRDYPEMPEAVAARSMLTICLNAATVQAEAAPVYFAAGRHLKQVADYLTGLEKASDQVAVCLAKVGRQPVSHGLQTILAALTGQQAKVSLWCQKLASSAGRLASPQLPDDSEQVLHCLLFRSLLGIQEVLKSLNDVVSKEAEADDSSRTNTCLVLMNQLVAKFPKLKAAAAAQSAGRLAARFQLEPSAQLYWGLTDSVQILAVYKSSLTSLLATCLDFTREFAKLLSVVLKVFHQVAIQVNLQARYRRRSLGRSTGTTYTKIPYCFVSLLLTKNKFSFTET